MAASSARIASSFALDAEDDAAVVVDLAEGRVEADSASMSAAALDSCSSSCGM